MIKIFKKVQFSQDENRMKSIADTKTARELYYSSNSKNVKFLLKERFSWMNNFIDDGDYGIEVGSEQDFQKILLKIKTLN